MNFGWQEWTEDNPKSATITLVWSRFDYVYGLGDVPRYFYSIKTNTMTTCSCLSTEQGLANETRRTTSAAFQLDQSDIRLPLLGNREYEHEGIRSQYI